MTYQIAQCQAQSAWIPSAWLSKTKDGVALGGNFWSEAHPDGLVDLLRNVAARSHPLEAGFDPMKMATALRERILGLELNLCDLAAQEERCLKDFLPEDWAAFQADAARNGGQGIAYVELNAELLPDVLPGLQQLCALECVSLWAPAAGGSIDFGILSGGKDPLRINILGTPEKPLEITVSEGVRVEGKELSCPWIQASWVSTTNEEGEVNPVRLPLAAPQLAQRSAPGMPCVDDRVLRDTLVRLLDGVARSTKFQGDCFDAPAVAKALVMCGRFDDMSDFGFDLEGLTAQQVRCVQALPSEAWLALQNSAEKAGEDISWLDLHDGFSINNDLVLSLKQLSPLFTLSVSTPAKGIYLALGKLQGGAAQLETLRIRCAAGKKWAVNVPQHVLVLPLSRPADGDDAMKQSKVMYEDASGRIVGEAALFGPAPGGTKV